MKPRFKVTAGGVDITSMLRSYNVELVVVDAAGLESDRVDFTIDDPNGSASPPEPGAVLMVWLGYGTSLAFMGQFVVDTVKFSGWPQTIRVLARSADQRGSLKERRTESYENKTLGQILSEVAGRNGLTANVASEVAGFFYPYKAQEEESDEAFASRLGRLHGCTVSVKNGQLIVLKRGRGGLGPLTVSPGTNLISYEVTNSDRYQHEKVEGYTFDRDEVVLEKVEAPASSRGPTFRIRNPFPRREQAEEAAKAKADELKQNERTASFEIEGDPAAVAEMDVICSGARGFVDGPWVTDRVQHRWGVDIATSTLSCKTKI
ncbi:MAG: contractile injection system protein, VgrG/Pvc8 family [Devosia sp.]